MPPPSSAPAALARVLGPPSSMSVATSGAATSAPVRAPALAHAETAEAERPLSAPAPEQAPTPASASMPAPARVRGHSRTPERPAASAEPAGKRAAAAARVAGERSGGGGGGTSARGCVDDGSARCGGCDCCGGSASGDGIQEGRVGGASGRESDRRRGRRGGSREREYDSERSRRVRCSDDSGVNPRCDPTVVWFRSHDLRVHDQPALDAAVASGRPVVAVFVLEHSRMEWAPPPWYGIRGDFECTAAGTPPHRDAYAVDGSDRAAPPMGRAQCWYLHYSLLALSAELAKLGVPLAVRRGDPAVELPRFAAEVGAADVYWLRRQKPRQRLLEDAVQTTLIAADVVPTPMIGALLLDPRAVPRRFDDFHSYMAFWLEEMRVRTPSPANQPLSYECVVAATVGLRGERGVADLFDSVGEKNVDALGLLDIGRVGGSGGDGGGGVGDDDDGPLSVLGMGAAATAATAGAVLPPPGDVSNVGCVAAAVNLAAFLNGPRFRGFADDEARRDGMLLNEDQTTSRLSPHLRFGELSPRFVFHAVVAAGAAAEGTPNEQVALSAARAFLKNLCLREFGYYMLHRHPLASSRPIVPEYHAFPWADDVNGSLTLAWQTGTTGYPIVDAAMRQLAQEGWIHNRMRYLVASFYCKYLLLPWHVGAAYLVFALVDGDDACNSLGWQWIAGCNSDAIPSCHMINPAGTSSNGARISADAARYVRKYVPELAQLPDHFLFEPWTAPRQVLSDCGVFLLSRDDFSHAAGAAGTYPTRVVQSRQARPRARNAINVMRRIFQAHKIQRVIIGDSDPCARAQVFEASDRRRRAALADATAAIVSLQHFASGDGCHVLHEDATRAAPLLLEATDRTPLESCEEQDEESAVDALSLLSGAPSVSTSHFFSEGCRLDSTGSKRRRVSSSTTKAGNVGSNTESVGTRSELTVVEPMISTEAVTPRISHSLPLRPARPPSPETQVLDTWERGSGSNKRHRSLLSTQPSDSHSPSLTGGRVPVSSLLSPNGPGMWAGQSHSPSADRRERWNGSSVAKELQTLPTTKREHCGSGAESKDAGKNHAQEENRASKTGSGSGSALNVWSTSRERQAEASVPLFALGGSPVGSGSPSTVGSSLPPTYGYGHAAPQLVMYPGVAMPSTPGQSGMPGHPPYAVGGFGHQHLYHPHYQARLSFPQQTSPQLSVDVNGDGHDAKPPLAPSLNALRGNREAVQASPRLQSGVQAQQQQQHEQSQQQHNRPQEQAFRQQQHQLSQDHLQSTVEQQPRVSQPAAGSDRGQVSQPVHYMASANVNARDNLAMTGQPQYHLHPAHGFTVQPGPYGMVPQMLPPPPGYMAYSRFMPMMHNVGSNGLPVVSGQAGGDGLSGADSGANPALTQVATCQTGNTVLQAGVISVSPLTRFDREAIARRMAALDYEDSTQGGKHREQWQAIAQHLLKEYEFTDSTDRQTSRDYVRLCVLKDELRSSSRVRITVNHVKELFRILNLTVTGEWDRRGHGGVRGPYVYGLASRTQSH